MWPKFCVALVIRYDLLSLNILSYFFLISGISAIIHQLPCCCLVTTSKISLYVSGFNALF